jgi:hypothetical protein
MTGDYGTPATGPRPNNDTGGQFDVLLTFRSIPAPIGRDRPGSEPGGGSPADRGREAANSPPVSTIVSPGIIWARRL